MPKGEKEYSLVAGALYVINLIFGTGVLTMPHAFTDAGWLLGTVLVVLLSGVSYITATFVLESMAKVSNMANPSEGAQQVEAEDDGFTMARNVEICEMTQVLLRRPLRALVYTSLVLYLFGDLVIFITIVSATLTQLTCTYIPPGYNCSHTPGFHQKCWEGFEITRANAKRIYVCMFVAFLGPFAFFNVQKTKFLQLLTAFLRFLAYAIMLLWTVVLLVVRGKVGSLAVADLNGVPTLFGTCIYTFMCQHSIPGIIYPISDKRRLKTMLCVDYSSVALLYITISLTAAFAFKHIEEMYTINFWKLTCGVHTSELAVLSYYVALFPIFALSTSYPIVAITLKNNLMKVIFKEEAAGRGYIDQLLPIALLVVPLLLALIVSNVSVVVSLVGSYAGVAVQYLIPCVLVTAARSNEATTQTSPFESPFRSNIWVILLYVWSAISVVLITIYNIFFNKFN